MIFRWRVGLIPSNRGLISAIGGSSIIRISGGIIPSTPVSTQTSYAFVG